MKVDETVLPKQFHEFFRKVIQQKQKIRDHEEQTAVLEETDEAGTHQGDAQVLSTYLLSVLEQQALEAGRLGGEYGASIYKEAQYVMAALADEIFLYLEWEGKEAWKSQLLEVKLFRTHVAGELFYKRLDKLLKERDTAYTGMAVLYLLALSLGFRGKFRDKDDKGQLDYYRGQLFAFIYRKNPDLFNVSRRLFPEAYAYTLEHGTGKMLPRISRWIGLIILIIIVYLVISHVLWLDLTNDMMHIIEEFIKNNSSL